MSVVAIIDYGAGNLESVRNIVHQIGETTEIVSTPEAVLAADRIILPGVGAAGEAVSKLNKLGLIQALNEAVREKARPFLGICLGMQLLADQLSEFGNHSGFGWIKGNVVHLNNIISLGYRVPHMGWSQVEANDSAGNLFSSVRRNSEFYFSHSYVFDPSDTDNTVAATTHYDVSIAAAVVTETAFATQFHPEKSQLNGERLMTAFLDWRP